MADTGQPGAASKFKGLQISDAPPPRPLGRRPYVPPKPDLPDLLEKVWANYQENSPVAQQQSAWTYKWILPISPEDVELVRLELLKAKNWLQWKHQVQINGLEKKDVDVVSPDTPGADIKVRRSIPEGMCALRFAAHPPMEKGVRAKQTKANQTKAKLSGRGKARREEIAAHDDAGGQPTDPRFLAP